MSLKSINPYTNEVIEEFEEMKDEDIGRNNPSSRRGF